MHGVDAVQDAWGGRRLGGLAGKKTCCWSSGTREQIFGPTEGATSMVP